MAWGTSVIDETRRELRKRRRSTGDWWLTWTGLHMSLAFKLAVPVAVTTAILAAAMGATVSGQVNGQIERAYGLQAETVAVGVEVMFVEHPGDINRMNEYLVRLASQQPEIVSARIHSLDAGGPVIASSNPFEIGDTGLVEPDEQAAVYEGRAMQDENDGGVLITVRPLHVGELLFGAVIIRSSKAAQFAAIRSLTLGIGIAAGLSIGIESLFVLAVLYLGIIRRTRRVQHAVELVAHGDTSIRLYEGDEPRGRDEIFNLARSVDQMIASLDERQRGEALIRSLVQKALAGEPSERLIAESLVATRRALGLEEVIFAGVNEDGTMAQWRDEHAQHASAALPVWLFALTSVAIETRKTVVTERLGRDSRFADASAGSVVAHAAIVPLPRKTKAGQALIAMAAPGETIPDGGVAVLEAVAATIGESLHMQAAEAARAESAVKSKVMSAVSHEMRNPLNSILGFTGLVLRDAGAPLTDKQRRQLGFVQTSANNMLTLVNNYLDLSKLRGGSLTLQYEKVKIAPFVNGVLSGMALLAQAKQLTIRTSVTDDATARIDSNYVRLVLTNLVSNAIKFTPPGGRVFVRVKAQGDQLRIAVSDTGVGIPKDQRALVFTEFPKIDAGLMAAGKGTGLGLVLTKSFVSAMEGSIRVYSRSGRGSTFVVVLPREGGAEKRAPAA
ncbi:MAG TPA: ATP-binding protein [Candidatus Dormibacteraeota bacterium]|jgi:signal transduction histidine kinase